VTNDPGLSKPTRPRPLAKDLAGRDFGKLVALEHVASRNGSAIWLCRCECGGTREVSARNLCRGSVRSCGCIRWQRVAPVVPPSLAPSTSEAPPPCRACANWEPLEGADLGGWCRAERFMSGKAWLGRCQFQVKGGAA
jgi:hypothetical protein